MRHTDKKQQCWGRGELCLGKTGNIRFLWEICGHTQVKTSQKKTLGRGRSFDKQGTVSEKFTCMGWRMVWPNKRMERSWGSFDPLYDLRWKAYSKLNEKSSHFYNSWASFSLPVIKYVFSSLFFSFPLKQQLLQTCHALSEFCLLEVKVEMEIGQLPNNTQAKVLWMDHSTQTWKQCKTSFDTLTLISYLALHLKSQFHGTPFLDPSFDALDSHFRKLYTMFIHCGFPPLPPEHRQKLGSVISFVQFFTLYDWVLSLGHYCPAMDWVF